MCGRFTLILEPEDLQAELQLSSMPVDLSPRYNIAPSQPVAVVTDGVARAAEMFRWGLIPFWAKDAGIGNRMINARSETLAEKPAFRSAFARQRCLILADGFYEWQRDTSTGSRKGAQPYFFRLASGKPFAFAGLWDTWRPSPEETVRSCTIITCPANELVGRIHDRMPVMLSGDDLWHWLEPATKTSQLNTLLRPYPPGDMDTYPVSALVNNPANDDPACVRPMRAA
jgi:putative SOS response-associated peptidase YedK